MSDEPGDEPAPESTRHLRAVARLLDSAIRIPGTNIRFGADALIGLVPGVGDVAGAVFSGYIVLAAARLGVPTSVVTRMLMNIGIDTLVGSVPVLGDIFDVAWRSNQKNVALIEAHVADGRATRTESRLIVTTLIVGVVSVLALVGVGIVVLIAHLLRT